MGKLPEPVMEVRLPFDRIGRGKNKVREMFELVEETPEVGPAIGLMACTDRVSAYNVKLKSGIPLKGTVLNLVSAHWFQKTALFCPNHFIRVVDNEFFSDKEHGFLWGHDFGEIKEMLEPFKELILNRAMLFEVGEPVMIEGVVRDKLLGSSWEQYQETGKVNGIKLPKGLKKGDKLPAPIFTPTLKSKDDEPITYEQLVDSLGENLAGQIRAYCLSLYCFAQNDAALNKYEIDDTKFEFIRNIAGILKQSDESLTGDSSRYKPDYSKQIVRDYLDSIGFDRKTPIELPPEIIKKTSIAYVKMLKIITGKSSNSYIKA